jgi:hypothetical protein
MRAPLALLLAGLLALAGPVRGEDEPPEMSPEEAMREQFEALYDLHHATTDEEARRAEERFEAASEEDLERRRRAIDRLIER